MRFVCCFFAFFVSFESSSYSEGPGDRIEFDTPEGVTLQVVIPDNAVAGQPFVVHY